MARWGNCRRQLDSTSLCTLPPTQEAPTGDSNAFFTLISSCATSHVSPLASQSPCHHTSIPHAYVFQAPCQGSARRLNSCDYRTRNSANGSGQTPWGKNLPRHLDIKCSPRFATKVYDINCRRDVQRQFLTSATPQCLSLAHVQTSKSSVRTRAYLKYRGAVDVRNCRCKSQRVLCHRQSWQILGNT